ncbi:MAG: CDP-archaeol synthase [Clostridia bacterium]|nr:CDP-archaeol synthase [Clostridia bacterium]
MPTRKPSQTLIRTITGTILIILFAACMWASRYTAVLFFTAFGCIACVELANALHAMLIRSSPWPACILLVLLSAAMLLKWPTAWSIIALSITVIAVLTYALFWHVDYRDVLGTLAIILYPMLFFLLFGYVAEMERDHRLPILAVVIVSASLCDIGAYFIGRWLGKHPMAPAISPKKTIEGSIAGLLFGTLSGVGVYFALQPVIKLPLPLYLIASLLCSVAGEIGDLCASMIKRQANIKDYGKVLPGHGGIMDRCDSFVFALPVALLCFELYFTFVQ